MYRQPFSGQQTGSYSAPGGTHVQYRFLPNGRYEYAALTTQSRYSRSTKFMTYKTGTVAYQGDILTFVPETSKITSEDSCVARNNCQEPAGMNRETYRWGVERDEYGVKMCLAGEGVNGCAYKRQPIAPLQRSTRNSNWPATV